MFKKQYGQPKLTFLFCEKDILSASFVVDDNGDIGIQYEDIFSAREAL